MFSVQFHENISRSKYVVFPIHLMHQACTCFLCTLNLFTSALMRFKHTCTYLTTLSLNLLPLENVHQVFSYVSVRAQRITIILALYRDKCCSINCHYFSSISFVILLAYSLDTFYIIIICLSWVSREVQSAFLYSNLCIYVLFIFIVHHQA